MEQTAEPMDIDISFTSEDTTKERSQEEDITMINNSGYENSIAPFVTGIDVFCKEEQLKMEERIKRFGLPEKLNNSVSEMDKDLYLRTNVTEDGENTKNLRLNVLHMRGTEEMSTKDVFKYFEDYAPASIEWVNDVSCNVVWVDNISAARALLKLSKKIVGLRGKVAADRHLKSEASNFDDENNFTNDDDCIIEVVGGDGSTGEGGENLINDDNVISLNDIDCPLPPGLWRKGVDYPKSKAILLRFATRADKKQPNAEKMSEYYKKYGNPNFGGIKGLLTQSRKRMYKEIRQSKKRNNDKFMNSEVENKRSRNPWGVLSETWGQNDSVEDNFLRPELRKEQKTNVKERLGFKNQSKELLIPAVSPLDEESISESNSDSDDEEWCKRSKVLRMRMHADDEEEKMLKKRIKQRTQEMYSIIHSRSSDLRSRLGNARKAPVLRDAIQVVVTNVPEELSPTRAEFIEEEDGEISNIIEEDEPEEGECTDEIEHQDVAAEQVEEEEGEESEDSDVSEKEIQGPKGSVIKVVQRTKPRVASTVWTRLNNKNSGAVSKERLSSEGDLRGILKGDLRSRLGYHNRGRSPLRIEVKNDKYAEDSSGEE